MTDKITNTYHSAMGATKETIGKIVHSEHLMNSGRAERAQAGAKSGKHIAEDANQVQTSQTQTTVVETPSNFQSTGHPFQDDNRLANTQTAGRPFQDDNRPANTQSSGHPFQDENRRASNEHLAFM
ncbi:hypothetical protein MVEG_06124 [Podila verticillata NRRL 6337]|nr:hypothetical protein MVEG_06124 [Podila verticillata NRRL 6337]